MNESDFHEPTQNSAEYCEEAEQCVRRNPGSAILIALGAGLAIGLIIRALRPEPTPQHRVVRLLEDLEDRLRDATGPILRKASALAHDGLEAAQEGGSRAESLFGDATRRVRRLFS